MRKPTFWFPTRSNTNQAVQLQKMDSGLKKASALAYSSATCWNRLYEGTVFQLVFSQPCRVKGVGGLVRIAFRELSNTWKFLGLDGPYQPHG